MLSCPSRGVLGFFHPCPPVKVSPLTYFLYHTGTLDPQPSSCLLPLGTLEQCILGLVGMRCRRDGRSSCGPGPAPALDGHSEPQVLQITLFSCLSRARFLPLALCLLAISGH